MSTVTTTIATYSGVNSDFQSYCSLYLDAAAAGSTMDEHGQGLLGFVLTPAEFLALPFQLNLPAPVAFAALDNPGPQPVLANGANALQVSVHNAAWHTWKSDHERAQQQQRDILAFESRASSHPLIMSQTKLCATQLLDFARLLAPPSTHTYWQHLAFSRLRTWPRTQTCCVYHIKLLRLFEIIRPIIVKHTQRPSPTTNRFRSLKKSSTYSSAYAHAASSQRASKSGYRATQLSPLKRLTYLLTQSTWLPRTWTQQPHRVLWATQQQPLQPLWDYPTRTSPGSSLPSRPPPLQWPRLKQQ